MIFDLTEKYIITPLYKALPFIMRATLAMCAALILCFIGTFLWLGLGLLNEHEAAVDKHRYQTELDLMCERDTSIEACYE